jgi:uncharacterized protein YidB (DUF937 family)
MRAVLEAIVERLLAASETNITLDEVGEAIGLELVSQSEIEEILDRLERAGRRVGSVTPSIRQHLQTVLVEARALRNEQGSSPSVAMIAQKTGLSIGEVRAALLYASVLSR